MTFLASWFLIGLVSVSIPLVLHLRRSRRRQKIFFSTTQFFDERFVRSARRARIQDLLLLILRMALLAFFVLALAQPLIRAPWGQAAGLSKLVGLGENARHVAIILDDSASMAALSERGVLLDRAKAGAISLIDELSPSRGDKATVILAGEREAGPKILFERPTGDMEAVRDAVREVSLTDLATNVEWAIRAGAEGIGALGRSSTPGGAKEIYVFSDFQETALPAGNDPALGIAGVLFLVATRPNAGNITNLSVDALQYSTARPMVSVPFTFRTLLTNHGSEPCGAVVSLVIDGQTVSQKNIDLEGRRSRLIRLRHRFAKAGWHGGKVVLSGAEAEMLTSDNQRHFALYVDDHMRLLAINGAPSTLAAQDELFFFRLALTVLAENRPAAVTDAAPAKAPIPVEQITPQQVTMQKLAQYRVAVMANVAELSPQALEALEKYVDQGGSLLITLGDRVNAESYNRCLGSHRLHGGLLPGKLLRLIEPAGSEDRIFSEDIRDAGFIAALNGRHPALAGFNEGKLGSLTNVRFTKRYEVDPGSADVLMRGPSGKALLTESRFGQGRVMLFVSSIDRDWSNFPLEAAYLPWLYRIVSYLGQPGTQRANFLRTGQVVELPASVTQLRTLVIFKPDGTAGYRQSDPRESNPTAPNAFTDTRQAGLYVVRLAVEAETAKPRMMFATNIPPEESQLQYLEKEDLETIAGPDVSVVCVDNPESVKEAIVLARHGYGLWDLFLSAALIVALVEPLLASRLSKRRAARVADAMSHRDVLSAPDYASARQQQLKPKGNVA